MMVTISMDARRPPLHFLLLRALRCFFFFPLPLLFASLRKTSQLPSLLLLAHPFATYPMSVLVPWYLPHL